jgi:hypothetical protein
VSKYLGHATIRMTMRYSHLLPENDEQAIAAMMSVYTTKTDTGTDTEGGSASREPECPIEIAARSRCGLRLWRRCVATGRNHSLEPLLREARHGNI